ncbi:unnamed protein product [Blepharisma stoltei]|uniref:Uncharacterized protein n=1 Tax=Blepharisma stoltei TaxID=1481888 RepID=A0AAU9K0I7_9CILI|nr:unnamed protein product [Blepharisma stoltei]
MTIELIVSAKGKNEILLERAPSTLEELREKCSSVYKIRGESISFQYKILKERYPILNNKTYTTLISSNLGTVIIRAAISRDSKSTWSTLDSTIRDKLSSASYSTNPTNNPTTPHSDFSAKFSEDYLSMIQLGESTIIQKSSNDLKTRHHTFENGEIYIGEFGTHFMRNGQGSHKWTNGDFYEGNWKNDRRSGYGRMLYIDSGVYEGYWKHDKKHGKGKLTTKNGSVLEGVWVSDKLHGKAIINCPSGDLFEGFFINGKPDGYGKLITQNGLSYLPYNDSVLI